MVVENTFWDSNQQNFKIFKRKVNLQPQKVRKVAVTYLHNFLRKRVSSYTYSINVKTSILKTSKMEQSLQGLGDKIKKQTCLYKDIEGIQQWKQKKFVMISVNILTQLARSHGKEDV